MPGILPMKVIKMGSNAHMRIAQACDRCRSKKIRCDGVRPCCTQCANVGFECKTSDKLSRRAFPRGYTESLEERVRALETEVRELKDLLDEKDEKIDMLTRIHPQRQPPPTRLPPPQQRSSTSPTPPLDARVNTPSSEDATFTVQQSPFLTEDSLTDSYFVGTSSGSSFLESFKHKVQEKGRSADEIKPADLLRTAARQPAKSNNTPVLSPLQARPPPRLASDQFVNVFFQEWAPLFPILHRPTFLSLYEQFIDAPELVTDKQSIAQLYLVFSLAALSQGSSRHDEAASIELQWQTALQQVQTEQSLATLQCLLLAQLACMQKGDCSQLLTYKALAISLSARLGLHQSQKRFALGTLTCETRKKVFWTLYTIDSFSAVQLGLPTQIKDDEVFCELPVDADDEYINEKGFQPSLPGESTRVSSALALFRAARILSKVLVTAYPALPSYELSTKKLQSLAQELDQWQSNLAPHLRLPFAQDKPSVGTVSSRSPLLSLTYHYIRSLIHRPVVCASLTTSASSSSMLAMASSCKHIVQIMSLLTERGLSFSFCLNKEELLIMSGFGLLMQGLDLDEGSKVLKDSQRTLVLIISQLDKIRAREGPAFRRVACSFLPITLQRPSAKHDLAPASRHASDGSMPAPHQSTIPAAMKQHFKAMTAKLPWPEANKLDEIKNLRRMTHIGIPMYTQPANAQSQPVLGDTQAARLSRSEPARSPQEPNGSTASARAGVISGAPSQITSSTMDSQSRPNLNLDYLSFSTDMSTPGFEIQQPPSHGQQSEWERLLASIDNGQTNIFDNIYGGPPVDLLQDNKTSSKPQQRRSASHITDDTLGWDPQIWGLSSVGFTQTDTQPAVTESIFSLSTDEGSGSTMQSMDDSTTPDGQNMYPGIIMPDLAQSDDGIWDPIDQGYAIV